MYTVCVVVQYYRFMELLLVIKSIFMMYFKNMFSRIYVFLLKKSSGGHL